QWGSSATARTSARTSALSSWKGGGKRAEAIRWLGSSAQLVTDVVLGLPLPYPLPTSPVSPAGHLTIPAPLSMLGRSAMLCKVAGFECASAPPARVSFRRRFFAFLSEA